jgi:hypothetical protein
MQETHQKLLWKDYDNNKPRGPSLHGFLYDAEQENDKRIGRSKTTDVMNVIMPGRKQTIHPVQTPQEIELSELSHRENNRFKYKAQNELLSEAKISGTTM